MRQFEEKFGKRVLVSCHDLSFNLQGCVAENEEGPTTNVCFSENQIVKYSCGCKSQAKLSDLIKVDSEITLLWMHMYLQVQKHTSSIIPGNVFFQTRARSKSVKKITNSSDGPLGWPSSKLVLLAWGNARYHGNQPGPPTMHQHQSEVGFLPSLSKVSVSAEGGIVLHSALSWETTAINSATQNTHTHTHKWVV